MDQGWSSRRRTVLKTIGGAVVASGAVSGAASGVSTADADSDSGIEDVAYYTVNSAGSRTGRVVEHLYRSPEQPLRMETNEGGVVECRRRDSGIQLRADLTEGDEFAGAAVYLGEWNLQDFSRIDFAVEGAAVRVVMQFDFNDDGDFMRWKQAAGEGENKERWDAFAGDDRVISPYREEGVVEPDDAIFNFPPGGPEEPGDDALSISDLQAEFGNPRVWIGLGLDQQGLDLPGVKETVVTAFDVSTPTVYVGSQDGTLYAVDAGSGEQRWAFTRLDGRVDASPTAVEGTVYVGSNGTESEEFADAALYAVDAATGEQKWAFTEPAGRVTSSPTVVNGTVYVGSWDGTLYAVDAASGELEWTFDGLSAEMFAVSTPNVVDGTLYIGSTGTSEANFADSALHAVDAASGEEEWAFTEPAGRVTSSPTVLDDTVYVGSNGTESENFENSALYAVDASSGEQDWAFTDPTGPVSPSPTVVNGTVYVGSWDGTLYAVDAASGEQEWAFTEPAGLVTSSPTVVDDTVYVGGWDGTLYAVDAASGEQEWAFTEPAGRVHSSPTVVNGTVYVGSNGTESEDFAESALYAVDAATGEQEWAFTQPANEVFSSPTVVADPESGDSVGSRVTLGTLGHHHVWAERAALTAAFTVDPPSPTVGETVTFDASGSSSPDEEIVEYQWDFTGDGEVQETAADPVVTHTYDEPGEYEVTLTVTTAAGDSDTAADGLSVAGEGPPPLPGEEAPPQDLDGDGRYEDIDGDGQFTIRDVQLFFQQRDSDTVQNNAEAFNFDGEEPPDVGVGDVQALFQLFQER